MSSVPGLRSAMASTRRLLSHAEDIIHVAVQTTSHLVALVEETSGAVVDLIDEINGICPALRNGMCALTQGSCTLAGIFGNDPTFTWIEQHLTNNNNVVLDQVTELRDKMTHIRKIMKNSSDRIQSVDWLFPLATSLSTLLACCSFGVIVLLCWKSPARVRRWQRGFFFPVFLMLVAVALIFVVASVPSSTATADVCAGSPDDKLFTILKKLLSSMKPFTAEITQYIISRKSDSTPELLTVWIFIPNFFHRHPKNAKLSHRQRCRGIW